MVTKSDAKNKGLIVFLLILIVVIGFLSYQNAKDFALLKNAFETEKKELEKELDNVIIDYRSAISESHNFSEKLTEQLQKVLLLKDTIRDLQSSNYKLLRVYRKRVLDLEKENKILLNKVDSLNSVNQYLFTENDSVKEVLYKKEQLNSQLSQNYKRLENEMAIAKTVDVAKIDFNAMKTRSSGSLVTTYRSWKASAFKVTFSLLESDIADKGTKQIHIQIIDAKNDVINPKGRVRLRNGKKVSFSDVLEADYFNKELTITSLVKVPKGKMQKGIYKVKIYVNRVFTKESTIKLK